MPIDTQTFAISRWWAYAGLVAVQKTPSIFSGSQVRNARVELIAGKNQLIAIKNWLLSAQLIKKEGNLHQLTRIGKCLLDNDPRFQKSSTWWAFHLLCCLGEDAYPYNALFKALDTEIRAFTGSTDLRGKIVDDSQGLSSSTLDTYLDGVLNMFRRDGPLEGLAIVELTKNGRGSGENVSDSSSWRLGRPLVPDGAILFGLALVRQRHYCTRTSIDFGELISVGLHHFLTLSQDDLRQRIKSISRNDCGVSYATAANLDSISFDHSFVIERILVKLLQEGADTWM
jgi:ribosomal protein L27